MDEQRAREVLGDWIRDDNALDNMLDYMLWVPGSGKKVTLDSTYTAEQLRAIAWWMERKEAR